MKSSESLAALFAFVNERSTLTNSDIDTFLDLALAFKKDCSIEFLMESSTLG